MSLASPSTIRLYDVGDLPGAEVEDKRRKVLKYQAQADLMHANPGKYVLLESFDLESKARNTANNIRAGSLTAFWFGLDTRKRLNRKPDVDVVVRKTGETEYSVYAAYRPEGDRS